ncbi:MAG TPA: bifunctional 3-(3-hydroxy-phenyl)propionate/3-hydroxycinnamic acid hydroxylase [Actinophytocola sp.]|nr:bifunctional 3-(3-hydroxy-phenyl)propionate/3-hydroxycinnamic acid hydroxylase [Actinophytocola sp.]
MTEPAPTWPVIVVGAGPTGLVAALLLARYGIACTVLDRQHRPWPLPRAVHLDDEAVRVLQLAGVGDAFAAISRPAAGLRLLDARLRPFATFRRAPGPAGHGHPASNLFDQPELDALLRRAATRAGVELRAGLEVTGVADGADGTVTVTARDVATGREETLAAAAVLGCDGAASTVRGAIGGVLRDLGFHQRWLVLDVRCRSVRGGWDGVDQICDRRRAATFLHLTGDRYRWEFQLHPGESAAELARPDSVAALTAPWFSGAPDEQLQLLRCAEYTFRAQVADRWRAGRVLLLGDAAHVMPPFVGQGLGAGLRDAHNLAWKLAAVLRGRAGDELLDSYQAEREPHATAVIRTAVRVGRAMTGGNGLVAALRRPLAAALLRLPGAERRALAATTTRYPPGVRVDRRRHRRDLPGTTCPQPFVRCVDAIVRLDDVLGAGFALLHTGPVPPALRARADALEARRIRMGTPLPDDDADATIADDRTLTAWLRRGRAGAVLLRPDRVVMSSAGVAGQPAWSVNQDGRGERGGG